MTRRRKPPRRMVVFRCPDELHNLCEPIFRHMRGKRSAFMVAALQAMITKIGREGGVVPMPRVPRQGTELRDVNRRLNPPRP